MHAVVIQLLTCLGLTVFGLQTDFDRLLDRVSERVQKNYETLINVVYTETLVRQNLDRGLKAKGRPQQFVYTAVASRQPNSGGKGTSLKITRTLPDGKRRSEPKCTDPAGEYVDPLSFMTPENRSNYRMTEGGRTVLDGREAIILNVVSAVRETESLTRKEKCLSIRGPMKGRLWIDPSTADVMQYERELEAPVEFPPKKGLNSKTIKLVRLNVQTRFREIAFSNPQQTVLLPVSSETWTVVEGAIELRTRTTQTLTNQKRFVSDVIIKE